MRILRYFLQNCKEIADAAVDSSDDQATNFIQKNLLTITIFPNAKFECSCFAVLTLQNMLRYRISDRDVCMVKDHFYSSHIAPSSRNTPLPVLDCHEGGHVVGEMGGYMFDFLHQCLVLKDEVYASFSGPYGIGGHTCCMS